MTNLPKESQAPELAGYSPSQNELNVPVDADIVIQFDMDMNQSTVNSSTFLVHARSNPVPGTVSPGGQPSEFIFDPPNVFAFGDVITATLTDGIQSLGGTPFAGFSWSITVTSCG